MDRQTRKRLKNCSLELLRTQYHGTNTDLVEIPSTGVTIPRKDLGAFISWRQNTDWWWMKALPLGIAAIAAAAAIVAAVEGWHGASATAPPSPSGTLDYIYD
jgi:hypothetical protein